MFHKRLPPAPLPRVPEAPKSNRTITEKLQTEHTIAPHHQKQLLNLLLIQTEKAHKAINPNTGKLADLKELLKCSDGEHWSNSNSDEIGRLTQVGTPKPKRDPTLCNSLKGQPHHRDESLPTSARCATTDLKRLKSAESDGQREATKLTVPATALPKQLTSQPSKHS